jgi:hypothetical protein
LSKPYNNKLSALDQIPLFRPAGPAGPAGPANELWQHLTQYDPPEGPDDQRSSEWMSKGPEDRWASYWMKGLGAVLPDGIDWSRPRDPLWSAVKGRNLRPDIGRRNAGYVAGAAWSVQQYLATAVADHIEIERYEAERPVTSAIREVPNMIPATRYWFRAALSGVKMAMSAFVEVYTGWEVLNREAILRGLARQKEAIISASMPTDASLIKQPFFAGFKVSPLTSRVFKNSTMYKEYTDAFSNAQWGNTARTP